VSARLAGLALCAALIAVVTHPGIAGAAGSHVQIDVVGSGEGFVAQPTGPLVDTSGLAPGRSASGTMGVRSDFADSTDLTVELVDVADDDNGCTHAERAVDDTCGRAQGDLGADLVFTLAVSDSANGTYLRSWTGRAAQLERGVAVTQAVAAGAETWVRLDVDLPSAAGNETQTDTYGFGVRVVVQSDSGGSSVQIPGGSGADSGGSGGARDASGTSTSGHSGLAFTGFQVAMAIVVGGLLVAGGAVLVGGAAMRRRRAGG
jgi:hypothetical protein